jgi:hypothetical protein
MNNSHYTYNTYYLWLRMAFQHHLEHYMEENHPTYAITYKKRHEWSRRFQEEIRRVEKIMIVYQISQVEMGGGPITQTNTMHHPGGDHKAASAV